MADEKRQLILDLLARNKMTSGTAEAARDIDKVGTAADAAGKKTDKLGRSAEGAGRATDDLGDEAATTAGKISKLDREIGSLNQDLVLLAGSMADAGSKAERLDISKGIRAAQNDLRRLTGSKGILEKILPDPDPQQAMGWAKKLNASLVTSLGSAGPLPMVGGILGAAIAPTLGAAVAGAVVGGAGAGGLLGGAALAVMSRDKFVTYGTRIGESFRQGVTKEAQKAFSEGMLSDQFGKIEALAERSIPKIGKVFAATAPHIGKFTDNLVRSADVLLNSFVGAASKSGPAIDALGRLVQGASEKVSGFVDMLAEHGDAGADAIDEISSALNHMIDATSLAVESLINTKEALNALDGAIDSGRYKLEDNVSWLDLTADGYKKGSQAAELYRQGLIGVAGSANDYEAYIAGAVDSTGKLAEGHSNAEQAARGQQDALDDLSKELRAQTDPAFALLTAQDKLADANDKAERAVKKHGRTSEEARKATRDLAIAALDLQGKAGALGASFDGKLTPAMRTSLRAAGLTERQIEDVAAEFVRAKQQGNQFAKTYSAHARVTGAAAARRALWSVKDIADDIPRAVTIAMRVTGTRSVSAAAAAVRKNVQARASGGPISRGMPYLVGEHGPELVVPAAAGRVMSAAATRGSITNTARQVGAQGTAPTGGKLVVDLRGPEEVRAVFRKLVREMNLLPGYAMPGAIQ